MDGDFIFVNKFAYGLRLPVTNTKIVSIGHPQRGDVIVFRLPSDPSTHFIKRLIGLPGDHVVVRDNRVIINWIRPVTLGRRWDFIPVRYGFNGAELALERLDDGQHTVMFALNRRATDYEGTVHRRTLFLHGR